MTAEPHRADFRGVRWRSVEWTNLCTLYLRACESQLAHPVLGDWAAAEAVERIDYDFARLRRAVQPWGSFRVRGDHGSPGRGEAIAGLGPRGR